MSADDQSRWDDHYRDAHNNATAGASSAGDFSPWAAEFPRVGHALDLACGLGPGTLWLAERGMQVQGLDISPVAIELARAGASAAGVAARTTFSVTDLDDGLPDGPPVDVLWCQRFNEPALDAAMLDCLAPNGLLAISALSEVGGEPGRFTVAAGELPRRFAPLTVVAHREEGGLSVLLARKPRTPHH